MLSPFHPSRARPRQIGDVFGRVAGYSSWQRVTPGGGPGVDPNDYVRKDGDTMTGTLTLAGDPTAGRHAATKSYVDNRGIDGGTF